MDRCGLGIPIRILRIKGRDGKEKIAIQKRRED
jgi:hypothetical protein